MTEPYDLETPVLVVGGGIAGLSTAFFLGRLGIRSTLVERHPSTAILPQARAINPRSMEIYRSLGLEAEIRAQTSILADMPEMIGTETLIGEERFRIDQLAMIRPAAALSPTDWALIDQDDLERIVRAHAETNGADVRFGAELVSLETEDEGVTALVRELETGTERRIRAQYVVAADGHRAGVRKLLGVGADVALPAVETTYAVFDADLTEALRDRRFLLAYLDRPTQGTVLVPLRTFGRWMLGVPNPPAPADDSEEAAERQCVEFVRAAVGDPDLEVTLVPPVPGWSRKVSHSSTGGWVADRLRVGRVFFAGDAAHVVPPSGSYGATTGIQDAHNLAWKLAAVLGGVAGPQLLATYEQERLPVARVTLEQALLLLRVRHSGSQDELTSIDDMAMMFGYRYDSAAIRAEGPVPAELVADPHEPTGLPGLRAPHVWLSRDGGRVSTVDLFTGSFTVLAGPDGEAWTTAAARVASTLGIEMPAYRIGAELRDTGGEFSRSYGLSASGATLVRPDGFVCWRSAEAVADPESELREVLSGLLARKVASAV
ncbi:FAD-dependent oxidoreductase [Amycolatopsis circi]|uniref:FAD-dependent oxidoreductase n=1 Tax=Amycolatopsis circi TaxID=871959 RepID=UPI000E223EF7|nr:FAD-dependent oxidoreductase [Amycolatopsis circi]